MKFHNFPLHLLNRQFSSSKFQAIFHLSEIISEVTYEISGRSLPLGHIVTWTLIYMIQLESLSVPYYACIALPVGKTCVPDDTVSLNCSMTLSRNDLERYTERSCKMDCQITTGQNPVTSMLEALATMANSNADAYQDFTCIFHLLPYSMQY